MKTLYLVRHAKSSWKEPKLDDKERPLNKKGKNDAPLMGEILKDKGLSPNLIVSSTAKRASKTALIIAEILGYPKDKINFMDDVYEATTHDLLEIIGKTEEKKSSLMIFGHNPGLTMLHNYLSKHYIDNIPTCGIVALKFNCPWKEINKNSAEFLFFEYPKLYNA
jgi:phosphohistidine phosphatase